MKLARTVLVAIALAVVAACSSNPTAPSDEPNLGRMGSGHAIAQSEGPSFGRMGSGH